MLAWIAIVLFVLVAVATYVFREPLARGQGLIAGGRIGVGCVIAEAVGGQYSEYARVATYTGMPTVLGWPGHEGQWRDGALQGSRQDDIATLYSTDSWDVARTIIDRYDIRYVYVGNLERNTYHINEEKFNLFLKPIYQQGSVTIYEVP